MCSDTDSAWRDARVISLPQAKTGSGSCTYGCRAIITVRQELTEDALGFDTVARWRLTAELATVSGHLYNSDPQDPVLGLLWQVSTVCTASVNCP